jgi:hypothetical protein
MTYIIFRLLHNLFDLCQVSLSKTAKHWDSFFTHCILGLMTLPLGQIITGRLEKIKEIHTYTPVTEKTTFKPEIYKGKHWIWEKEK